MSEFKGTKTEWELLKGTSLLGVQIGKTIFGISNINEVTKANALLISKSPLLLKAIKDSINELREVGLNDMANYHEKLYNECVNL